MTPHTLCKLLGLKDEMEKFLPRDLSQDTLDVLLPNFNETGLQHNAAIEGDYIAYCKTRLNPNRPFEVLKWNFLYFATSVTHVFLRNYCPVSVFPFDRKPYVWIDVETDTFKVVRAPESLDFIKVQYKNERYAVNMRTGAKMVSSKGLYIGIEPLRVHQELDIIVVLTRKSQYEACYHNNKENIYELPTVIHIL